MDFNYTENQKMIADMVQQFAKRKITPFAREWDDKQHFPYSLFQELGSLGLMGILVPEKYNGSGFGYFEYVTAIQELAIFDPSIALSVAAHNSLCTGHILNHGNQNQIKKWVTKLATGQFLGAWGLTEHNTGSDAGGMNTTAVKVGNEWVLNGTKNFITHGISADVYVIIARTGNKGDSRGMSAFIIDKSVQGISSGKKEDKLGMRASETSEVILDNCHIPLDNIIGDIGQGFIQSMKILDGGRISIAALSQGISMGAFKTALNYSKQREQFGKKISQFQAISFKLVDMYKKIEASEMLIYHAAQLKNRNKKVTKESAMAKFYSSESCVEISSEAVQILGGYGYTKDFPAEKFYRDSKLCTIGEGTTQIQKQVISNLLFK